MIVPEKMTDYDKTYSEFKWEIPEYYNFAVDTLDYWAQDPAKQAMLWVDDDGTEIKKTFLDFSIASKKLANLLKDLGVSRNDVVIVVLGRDIAWWEIFTACIRMGALVAPGTTQLTAKDLKYRINTAGAVCFITDNLNAAKLDEVADACPTLKAKIVVGGPVKGWIDYDRAVEAASDSFEPVKTKSTDDCLIYFTSGTTGQPKMTLHTHSYPVGHQVTGRFWLDLTPQDFHWNVSDTGWAKAAYSSYCGPWNCGTAVFVHQTERFDPETTLELLQKYPITTMCGAPTIYRMLVQQDLEKYNIHSLRHCVGAGEPLNPEIIEVWERATGIIIRDGYGQTETVLVCGNFLCFQPRFGSMGKPSPGFDVQIIDEDGNILPEKSEGDIAVRIMPEKPPGIFKEYWKEPGKTESVRHGDYYLTGDRGYKDEDGYFWFVGRSDDVILSSGYRIGPFEVESALIEHPAVAESAVVSSPDETRGEVVKAFIILTSGYKPGEELVKEIQEYVKKATAPYKYPRKIEFVDELPKTVSGKIRRIELRNREWGL